MAPPAGKVSVAAPRPPHAAAPPPALAGLGAGSLPGARGAGHRNLASMNLENQDVLLDLEGDEEEDDDNDDGEIGE